MPPALLRGLTQGMIQLRCSKYRSIKGLFWKLPCRQSLAADTCHTQHSSALDSALAFFFSHLTTTARLETAAGLWGAMQCAGLASIVWVTVGVFGGVVQEVRVPREMPLGDDKKQIG